VQANPRQDLALTSYLLGHLLPSVKDVGAAPLVRLQLVVVEGRILAHQVDQREDVIRGRVVLVVALAL